MKLELWISLIYCRHIFSSDYYCSFLATLCKSATYSINQTRQKSLEVAKGKEEISQPYTITRWVIKMSEQLNQQVLSMSYRICQPSNDTQCTICNFRFAPFWGNEKLSSIIASFLAGNGSYDGFINNYQKISVGKCGKACFSTFVCFSLDPKVCA